MGLTREKILHIRLRTQNLQGAKAKSSRRWLFNTEDTEDTPRRRPLHWTGVGEVVEAEAGGIGEGKRDARSGAAPAGADAAEFTGLDLVGDVGEVLGADGYSGFGVCVVADIEADEDEGHDKAEFRRVGVRFPFFVLCKRRGRGRRGGRGGLEYEVEGAELGGRDTDLPLGVGPVNDPGGVLSVEDGSGGQVGVVKGDI